MIQNQTMGTYYSITIVSNKKISSHQYQVLSDDINKNLNDINQQMSTYISNSEISQWNQMKSTKWNVVSPEFYNVLENAISISRKTKGKYDVTLAPIIKLWGFDTLPLNKSLEKNIHPKESILKWFQSQNISYGYQYLRLKIQEHQHMIKKERPNLQVNLSSIAKGYAVDVLNRLLQKYKQQNFLIDIGGELSIKGYSNISKKGKWNIGIQDPTKAKQSKVYTTMFVPDGAIATSGNYRNVIHTKKKHFSHTIDSTTLQPIKTNILSVSVYKKLCLDADGWATALMTMNLKEIQNITHDQKLAAFVILKKGNKTSTWSSQSWKNKISSAN